MNGKNISSQDGANPLKSRVRRARPAADAGTSRIITEVQNKMGQMEGDVKKLREIVHASLVKSTKRGEAIEDIQRTLTWLRQEMEQRGVPERDAKKEAPAEPGKVSREEIFGIAGTHKKKDEENRPPPYMKFIEGKGRQGYRDSSRKPVLERLPKDYLSVVLVMRWIEFLMERVVRDKISLVLDYYKDIGWISEDVKSTIMSYARGENQDITRMDMNLGDFEDDSIPMPSQVTEYRRVDDWRLTAEDHLKSLLFVQMIAGLPVDKDRLSSLEQVITKIKRSLEGFHSV